MQGLKMVLLVLGVVQLAVGAWEEVAAVVDEVWLHHGGRWSGVQAGRVKERVKAPSSDGWVYGSMCSRAQKMVSWQFNQSLPLLAPPAVSTPLFSLYRREAL